MHPLLYTATQYQTAILGKCTNGLLQRVNRCVQQLNIMNGTCEDGDVKGKRTVESNRIDSPQMYLLLSVC